MVIGVTGGIGSGKSTVLNVLAKEYNALVIEADVIAKDIRKPGKAAYNFMVELLGKDILSEDRNINNKIVGEILFNNETLLAKVNEIIHPLVKREICNIIKESSAQIVAVEAALFIEAGYMDICDKLWVVYCEKDKRIQRLINERGYTKDKAEQIISLQLTDEEFETYANDIIDNSTSVENTEIQVRQILSKYWEDLNGNSIMETNT